MTPAQKHGNGVILNRTTEMVFIFLIVLTVIVLIFALVYTDYPADNRSLTKEFD